MAREGAWLRRIRMEAVETAETPTKIPRYGGNPGSSPKAVHKKGDSTKL